MSRLLNKKVLIFVGLVILCLAWFFYGGDKEDYVWANKIEITEDGFNPSSIAVLLGDEIEFLNNSDEDVWPASDFHPSHDIYKEFDTKGVLPQGDSWKFKFTKEGKWNFHDHLHSGARGIVYVFKDKNSIIKELSIEDCKNSDIIDENTCLSIVITETIKNKSLQEGLDLFYESRTLLLDCHDLAHKVGEAAYDAQSNGEKVFYGEITNLCNWGFWHGFANKFIQESGFDYNETEKFCAKVDSAMIKRENSNCFHGIGIGLVPDPPNPKIWGNFDLIVNSSVKNCDIFERDNQHYSDCLRGAFHGIVDLLRKGLYGLKLDEGDPFRLCKIQDSNIKKIICYSQAVQLYSVFEKVNISEFVNIFLNSEDFIESKESSEVGKYISLIFFSQIPHRNNHNLPNDPESLVGVCRRIPEYVQTHCIRGFARGFINTGNLNDKEYVKSAELCGYKDLKENERVDCLKDLTAFMSIHYKKEDLKLACEDMKKETGQACIN